MKKLLFALLASAASAAVVSGCKSIDVERHASSIATVTKSDGSIEVIRDAANNPVILDGGWNVEYFQHWNWQRFDELHAKAGEHVVLDINGYASGADSNLVALVSASLQGVTNLVATAAEAYANIAGGAAADTAISVGTKIYEYFASRGGDVAKATVTTSANAVKVTDGTVAIECDKSGNCTDCEL